MDTWVWIAAYVVGFALLHLYLYRYVRSTTTSSKRTTPVPEGRTRAVSPPEGLSSEDAVACESCGVYNENYRMFVFCRECGGRL